VRDELPGYWTIWRRLLTQQIQFDDRVRVTFKLPMKLPNTPVARNIIVSAHEGFGETIGNAF
jgi:hypothetical protein